MTPDAAFGFERRGTPDAVAELGARDGFEVVVVPPFTLEGRPVRSSEIRDAIADGRPRRRAATLLGRRVTLTGGAPDDDGRVAFELPMAVPPDGAYACHSGRRAGPADQGPGRLPGPPPAPGRCTVELRRGDDGVGRWTRRIRTSGSSRASR